jgi:hypothetical protein
MTLDRNRLLSLFDELGANLVKPATICVIGSTPGIVLGQPERQSQDIDIWSQRSSYDETEFRRACQDAGVLFDPRGQIDPNAIYVQIIRPGIVNLPEHFEIEVLGRYGALTVAMPAPALLVAAKLVRCEPRDIEDAAWWIKERALELDDVKSAVATLPNQLQQEVATENIVLVGLVTGAEKPK